MNFSKRMKRERNVGDLSNSLVPKISEAQKALEKISEAQKALEKTSEAQKALKKTPGSQRRRHPPLPAQP